MEDREMEIRGQKRDGGRCQPLPEKVPREGWKLPLLMRTGRNCDPVLVNEGRPGGCQKGWEDRGQGCHIHQQILEGKILGLRLASKDGYILWDGKVVLEGGSHPVGEVEGQVAAGC